MLRIPRRRTDEYEISRCAVLEQLADIGRHLGVSRVVIGRLKMHALVLEHFEQFVLQHIVHFTDFVDKENTAVCVRHQTRFRLRHPRIRKQALCALINRVMH